MALTHHHIARYAGAKEYAILGDDIVIRGESEALKYQEIMEALGVSISLSKSVLPSPTSNQAEIAKRLFLNGVEVTPLPSKLMEEGVKHPILFAEFLRWVADRWTGEDVLTSPVKYNLNRELARLFKPREADQIVDLITWPFGPYFCNFTEVMHSDKP